MIRFSLRLDMNLPGISGTVLLLFCFLFPLGGTQDFTTPGRICGFIDTNFDQYTDLIVQTSDNTLLVFEQNDGKKIIDNDSPSFKNASDKALRTDSAFGKIESCAVADFDADSFPDLLLSIQKDDKYTALICFGSTGPFNCTYSWSDLVEQPFIVNIDLDETPDFIGFMEKDRICVFGSKNRAEKFANKTGADCFGGNNGTAVTKQFAHAFVDVNSREQSVGTNSILIGVEKGGTIDVQKWDFDRAEKKWFLDQDLQNQMAESKLFEGGKKSYGSPTFADFDADGQTDMLIPSYKEDSKIKTIDLLIWSKHKNWTSIVVPLQDSSPFFEKGKLLQLRAGDSNSDGYPDLILVIQKDKEREPAVLQNVLGQKFDFTPPSTVIPPLKADKPTLVLATFFDLHEDGNLDLLLQYKDPASGVDKIAVHQRYDNGDVTFLKAGLCTSSCYNCGNNQEGSKISSIGSTLYYEIHNTDYNVVRGRHSQLSQTSHNALQLPYALFGLGRSPNFVDVLMASIPSKEDKFSEKWKMIVPNSRIYVIPYPADDPDKWMMRLYVTPSKLILYSFAGLCFVCGVVLLIIFILQWRESREDKEEAKKERRDHLDLM